MNDKRLITAVLLFPLLFGGCVNQTDDPKPPKITDTEPQESESTAENTVSFADRLIGLYKNESVEAGETVIQVYEINNMLIAEADEEFAAYYAMELIPSDAGSGSDTDEMSFTAYSFSGFSNFGEYWNDGEKIAVKLTPTGFDMTKSDGTVTEYTRDDLLEPIHIPERNADYLEAVTEISHDPSLTGEWVQSSDGYSMMLRMDSSGNILWCSKKDGEPVSVHIGVSSANPDSGIIVSVSERIGYAEMPYKYDTSYYFNGDGNLVLKNCEPEGLLPTDGEITFVRLTPEASAAE